MYSRAVVSASVARQALSAIDRATHGGVRFANATTSSKCRSNVRAADIGSAPVLAMPAMLRESTSTSPRRIYRRSAESKIGKDVLRLRTVRYRTIFGEHT